MVFASQAPLQTDAETEWDGGGGNGDSSNDNFMKTGLNSVASALSKLAAKAVEAIPGLIGTIVSYLILKVQRL